MADQMNALVLDLVEWVAKEPRPYADVFEDAVDRGFIESRAASGGGVIVAVTAAGAALLQEHGRLQHAASR
jgi:hypothetical protein